MQVEIKFTEGGDQNKQVRLVRKQAHRCTENYRAGIRAYKWDLLLFRNKFLTNRLPIYIRAVTMRSINTVAF